MSFLRGTRLTYAGCSCEGHERHTATSLMEKPYRICLADYECLLPALSRIIHADYQDAAYTKASDEFYESDEDSKEWKLIGELGSLTVLFEQDEGYLFSWFEA